MISTNKLKNTYINEIYTNYYKNLSLEGNNSEILEKYPEIRTFNDFISHNLSLKRLYEQIIDFQKNHSYYDAIFFADKLLTLTDAHPIVIYLLG